MRVALLVLSFALAACGGGSMESTDNHGFGWEFDAMGASGLKLRFKPHLPDNGNIFTDPAHYERLFTEVDACAGMSAPMTPYLILVDALGTGILGPTNNGVSVNGRFFSDPPLIVMDFRAAFSPQVVKEERLHHVLMHNGVIIPNGDWEHDHGSPLFDRCAFH